MSATTWDEDFEQLFVGEDCDILLHQAQNNDLIPFDIEDDKCFTSSESISSNDLFLGDEDTSTDGYSSSSSSSLHEDSSLKKKPTPPATTTTTTTTTKPLSSSVSRKNLSKEEKLELRKMRNRELASESRKRKSDEMSRLREENAELKARLAELEKYLPAEAKRPRSSVLSASVAVCSLVSFVLVAEEGEVSALSTASVLITALDSCEGLDAHCFMYLAVYGSLCFVLCAVASFMLRFGAAKKQSYSAAAPLYVV